MGFGILITVCFNLNSTTVKLFVACYLTVGVFYQFFVNRHHVETVAKQFFDCFELNTQTKPKFIWKAKVPSKVKAFIWIMVLSEVNIIDVLQVRRPHKSLCLVVWVLCFNNKENHSQLFLHCSVTWDMLNRLFAISADNWVAPRKVEGLLLTDLVGFKRHKDNRILSKCAAWNKIVGSRMDSASPDTFSPQYIIEVSETHCH